MTNIKVRSQRFSSGLGWNHTRARAMPAAIQAAGHAGAQQENGLFIKPSCRQEADFYQWVASTPLADFVPTFLGTLTENVSRALSIVLEDLCAGFAEPAVLDVKLGRVLYDAACLPEKRARLQRVADATTSGSLAFRIAGMTRVENGERVYFGKEYGRAATPHTVGAKLARFFPDLGNDYMYSVLRSVVAQLEGLRDALKSTRVEMHSASVLVVYEGSMDALVAKATSEDAQIVDVRLIDFAHSRPSAEPDADSLAGVENLLQCLDSLA